LPPTTQLLLPNQPASARQLSQPAPGPWTWQSSPRLPQPLWPRPMGTTCHRESPNQTAPAAPAESATMATTRAWAVEDVGHIHRALSPTLMYVTSLPQALQAAAVERLRLELRTLGVSRADAKAILARAAEPLGSGSPRAFEMPPPEIVSSTRIMQGPLGAGTTAARTTVITRRATVLKTHLQRKRDEGMGTLLSNHQELLHSLPSHMLPPPPAGEPSSCRGFQSLAFQQHAPSPASLRPRPCAAYSFSFGPVPPRPLLRGRGTVMA